MCQVNGLTSGGKAIFPKLVTFCNGAFAVHDDPLTAAGAALTYVGVVDPPIAGSYPVIWPYKPDGTGGLAFAYASGAEVPLFLYANSGGSTARRIDDAGIPTDTGWPAPTGTPPDDPICLCIWADRLVVSDGENFYMSRAHIHNDWDYAQSDDGGAIAGNLLTGATIGDGIVALVPANDDTLYVFCHRSIFRFIGNPRAGGRLENVSRNVGIIGSAAWSYDPIGGVWFCDSRGLWYLTPGGSIQPIGRERIRSAYDGINPTDYRVSVVWHEPWRSCFVFLTRKSTGSSNHVQYYPMGEKEWFGVNAFNNNNIGPLSAISFKSAANSAKDLILLGGRDSNVYYYDLKAVQDAGTDFTSYAYIGPYEMAGPGQTAMIHSLDVVLGETPGGLPVGADWQMRAVMTVASDAYSGIIGAMAEQTLTFDLYTAFGIQDRQPCAIASQIAWLRIDNLNADGSLTGGNNHKKFWAVERMYFRASAGGEQHGHNT